MHLGACSKSSIFPFVYAIKHDGEKYLPELVQWFPMLWPMKDNMAVNGLPMDE